MIQANDLRIGNWVQNKSEYIQIGDFDNIGINRTAKGNGYLDTLDRITGIPLSPSVLEDCGMIAYGSYGIYKSPCGKLFELYGDDFYFFHRGTRISSPVKYLHQLQNLFFSLFGKELEYKPKK